MSERILYHDEIRFRILGLLYDKFYEKGESIFNTEDVIKELKLDVERQLVYREITYLYNKNLIWGKKVINSKPIIAIRINEQGIDFVEKIIHESPNGIEDDCLKQELECISEEGNNSPKIKKISTGISTTLSLFCISLLFIFKIRN
jgi:hypothetical protein